MTARELHETAKKLEQELKERLPSVYWSVIVSEQIPLSYEITGAIYVKGKGMYARYLMNHEELSFKPWPEYQLNIMARGLIKELMRMKI